MIESIIGSVTSALGWSAWIFREVWGLSENAATNWANASALVWAVTGIIGLAGFVDSHSSCYEHYRRSGAWGFLAALLLGWIVLPVGLPLLVIGVIANVVWRAGLDKVPPATVRVLKKHREKRKLLAERREKDLAERGALSASDDLAGAAGALSRVLSEAGQPTPNALDRPDSQP